MKISFSGHCIQKEKKSKGKKKERRDGRKEEKSCTLEMRNAFFKPFLKRTTLFTSSVPQSGHLYSFAKATITKYYSLVSLNGNLFFQFWRPEFQDQDVSLIGFILSPLSIWRGPSLPYILTWSSLCVHLYPYLFFFL